MLKGKKPLLIKATVHLILCMLIKACVRLTAFFFFKKKKRLWFALVILACWEIRVWVMLKSSTSVKTWSTCSTGNSILQVRLSFFLFQCKLELKMVGGPVDHGTAFGRIAFSCAKEEVTITFPLPLSLPRAD